MTHKLRVSNAAVVLAAISAGLLSPHHPVAAAEANANLPPSVPAAVGARAIERGACPARNRGDASRLSLERPEGSTPERIDANAGVGAAVFSPFEPQPEGDLAASWTEVRMHEALPMPLLQGTPNQDGEVEDLAEDPGGPVLAPSGLPGDVPREYRGESADAFLPAKDTDSGADFGVYPLSYTRYRAFPDSLTTYKTFPYRTNGALFFTAPDGSSCRCSATSVNSTNRSVVWTAGHCVYIPQEITGDVPCLRRSGWNRDFLFVPARRAGSNPYGSWTWRMAATTTEWYEDAELGSDMGGLVLNRGGDRGEKIGDAVGYVGFLSSVSRLQHWHLLGYPAAPRDLGSTPPGPQFDGEHIEICAATWAVEDSVPGANPNGVGCDMTGGASGGPWLLDLNPIAGKSNYLNSNNSYKKSALDLYGPRFASSATALRDALQSQPVP